MTTSVLRGHPASPGAALGPAWSRAAGTANGAVPAGDAEARVRESLGRVEAELGALADRLRRDGHAADAEIMDANRLMAGDAALVDGAIAATRRGLAPADAIAEAAEPHVRALASLDDPTLAARAADLRAIARRAGELADGRTTEPPEGAIVLAEDLGPGEVAAWAGRVAAIVLAGSGATAHAAIVARSLGIPLVTGAGPEALAIPDGEELGVDADRGLVVRAVAADVRERLARRIARAAEEAERARDERHEPAATIDGRAVRLLANAGTEAEVLAALELGAEGIGLLRSELQFLEADGWPDEAAHRRALEPLLEPLAHRIATVRTLDFGGDKTPPFLAAQGVGGLLGPRGIRLALAADGGVEPQLRALLAVAGEAVVRILVPMVSDPAEVDAVRALARAARDAVAPDAPDPIVGAMIEIPAAALNAAAIARRCDFLSVGTNDLVQYTLAADRQDPGVAERAVAYHPSVVRLIARVVLAAHGNGIPVDVCGEAAGDAELLPLLIGLGVDEISVSPARLAATRRMIRSLSAHRSRSAVAAALAATSPAEVAAAAHGAFAPSVQVAEQLGEGVHGR